jgi:hypothetical protein
MGHALLIFHFLGLMLGITGSLGGAATLAYQRPAQKQKGGSMRGVGPAFARMATFGVILLWPTGIVLLLQDQGPGLGALTEPMFLMKSVFVLLLTFTTFSIETIYAKAKQEPQLPRLLVSLGPLAVIAYVAAVSFSVLAFN